VGDGLNRLFNAFAILKPIASHIEFSGEEIERGREGATKNAAVHSSISIVSERRGNSQLRFINADLAHYLPSLIFEACLNWSNEKSRPGLARMFEHSVMKKVSKKVTDASKMPYAGEDPVVVDKVRSFAGLFVRLLLEGRHDARKAPKR
jgi:hypothetical protein